MRTWIWRKKITKWVEKLIIKLEKHRGQNLRKARYARHKPL